MPAGVSSSLLRRWICEGKFNTVVKRIIQSGLLNGREGEGGGVPGMGQCLGIESDVTSLLQPQYSIRYQGRSSSRVTAPVKKKTKKTHSTSAACGCYLSVITHHPFSV